MAKAIMIQGAGSNVGKSMLVAGITRALTRRGLRVAPFKPQNMSNNAAVTSDGGEIGRAQALQARAAHRAPHTDMNPVLLKPETDTGAQVIVQGKRVATLKARDFGAMKSTLMPKVLESFHRLAQEVDIVVIEGAGSPAETNLRAGDIANMGFAEAANVPVVLVGDIDRGGVIAQLVGTHAVLSPADQNRIKAFSVNKFRGDVSLFEEGARDISTRTGWDDLGTLPWFENAHLLPAEDVLDLAGSSAKDTRDTPIKIAVPHLPRIANFDDLDPLSNTPEVDLEIIAAGRPLPRDADLILVPGSKSTIADLAFVRSQGWDIDIASHLRHGGHVLGICGGYQMLGTSITDPEQIEGTQERIEGLGLLDVATQMTPHKTLTTVTAVDHHSGHDVSAYEIHIGETTGKDCDNAWLSIGQTPHGAARADGRVKGCYLHGLFASDAFRTQYLQSISTAQVSAFDFEHTVEETLEQLASHIEAHLDLDALLNIAEDIEM